MQHSSRIVQFFVVLFALAAFALAVPSKRASTADVQTIFENLQAQLQPTLASINSTVSSSTAASSTIAPLMMSVHTEVNAALASVAKLGFVSSAPGEPSASDIATTMAGIITNIAETLQTVPSAVRAEPAVGFQVAATDGSLAQILTDVGTLVGDVLALVGTVLTGVAGLLTSVGLGTTATTAGV